MCACVCVCVCVCVCDNYGKSRLDDKRGPKWEKKKPANPTHFHDDEMNDEHFAFVIEFGDVKPAEVVRPASVVERRHATVVRADVQSRPSRILAQVQSSMIT